jgi:xylulokinase
MVLGLDVSTQSITALVMDPESGGVVHRESVRYGADLLQYHAPHGFIEGGEDGEVHADPRMWLDALDLVFDRLKQAVDLSQITMIAGAGQQHGSVYLDAAFEARLAALDSTLGLSVQIAPSFTRRTSPIWMDTSTGAECREIAAALGGDAEMCRRSGSIAIERFTGPQIRRFWKRDPAAYEVTRHIHLVSSFIASVLAGCSAPIDFGDAAGMNLLDLSALDWDPQLVDATARGLMAKLPPAMPTTTIIGAISPYWVVRHGVSPACRCALFTGDNPASWVGMGASRPDDLVISLGTSDTLFAAMDRPLTDPAGFGHVFGNPTGGYLSLICFRNGSLAREALRDRHRLDWQAFDRAALDRTRDAAGANLMLPFFEPEITPRHDFGGPVMRGSREFESGMRPDLEVRALLEGQFLNMRLHSQWMGLRVGRMLLTGGASANDGIAGVVADVFQASVERRATGDSAALGAAILAAVAAGSDLEHLHERCCGGDGRPAIEPDRALAAVYDDALVRFRSLLDDVRS